MYAMYDKSEESFCRYVDELAHLFDDQGIDFANINMEYNYSFPDVSYSELLIKELVEKLKNLLFVPKGMVINRCL